jgi:predicted nucleic acid-binding protein
VDAADSDTIIFAAKGDPRGHTAQTLLRGDVRMGSWIGSCLLLPEVLSLPLRTGASVEYGRLELLLARIDLKPVDVETALLATSLGAKYRLKAPDAIHLATAIVWGAERFHTNNSKDFGAHIAEIEVVLA